MFVEGSVVVRTSADPSAEGAAITLDHRSFTPAEAKAQAVINETPGMGTRFEVTPHAALVAAIEGTRHLDLGGGSVVTEYPGPLGKALFDRERLRVPVRRLPTESRR